MELVYLWVEEYKNIKKQGFNFSPRFKCEYNDETEKLNIIDKEETGEYYPKSFFGENMNITAIVGENGSGKSSILEIIANNSIPSILVLKVENHIIINRGKNYFNNNLLPKKVHEFNEEFKLKLSYASLSHFINKKINSRNRVSMNEELYPDISSNGYNDEVKENNKYILNLTAFLGNQDNFLGFLSLQNKIRYLQFSYCKDSYIQDFVEDNKNFLSFKKFLYLIFGNFSSFEEKDEEYFLNEEILEKYISNVDKKNLQKIEILSKNIESQTYNEAIINTNCTKELSDLIYILLDESKINIFKIFLLNEKKEKIEFSSGEYANLFYYGSVPTENDILLIDETDLYNHPNWQKKYIKTLIKKFKNQHIILTSHSPFILSDLPKENVIFLKDGKQVDVDIEQTFGANIHTLLSHGFFMENGLMGEFAKEKINQVYNFITKRDTNFIKTKKEAQDIINLIGEPLIKRQLQKLFDDTFEKNSLTLDDEIELLEKKLNALKELKK